MSEIVYLAWIHYDEWESDLIGVFTDTAESNAIDKAKAVCQNRHEKRSETTDDLHWIETKIANSEDMMAHCADYDGAGFVIFPHKVNEEINPL